jgi:hypothetical protein
MTPRILDLGIISGEGSSSRTRERAPGTHSIGVWVGPRTGLDPVLLLQGQEI